MLYVQYAFLSTFWSSIDWFKGKTTGKSDISWENPWCPVDFPISQPIEKYDSLGEPSASRWFDSPGCFRWGEPSRSTTGDRRSNFGHEVISAGNGNYNFSLVVNSSGWWWLEHDFYVSTYWKCHHPNWLSYFSEGLKPPTRISTSAYSSTIGDITWYIWFQ